MKNLRDALLKAGVVSEKQKRQAEHARRQEDKAKQKLAKSGATAETTPSQPPAVPIQSPSSERQAEENRRRKLIDLVQSGRFAQDLGGRRRFYFVSRSGIIPFLPVSESLGLKLERGQAAIVEDPAQAGDHTVVNREVALRLVETEPQMVRFFRQ